MSLQQLEEQKLNWEQEFEKMLLPDGVPSENNSLYNEGGITEWLVKHDSEHLYTNDVYREPMLDLDGVKVKSFIKSLLTEHNKRVVTAMQEKAFYIKHNGAIDLDVGPVITLEDAANLLNTQ